MIILCLITTRNSLFFCVAAFSLFGTFVDWHYTENWGSIKTFFGHLMIKQFNNYFSWRGSWDVSGLTSLFCLFFFFFLCRSGPVWTAHCSCHLFLHELRASQQWCWPTIGWRVSSGSSRKSLRCRAWLSCWWCGTTRTRVLLKVSVAQKVGSI